MSYLEEQLQQKDRKVIIEDTVQLIDSEVASKSGISGKLLQAGYKAVKALKGGRMIDKAVDMLLDDFTAALAPLHDDFRAQEKTADFGAYLTSHKERATDALLKITDDRAQQAEQKLIRSTYSKLRGQAEKHVHAALPGVGRLIDKHVPRSAA